MAERSSTIHSPETFNQWFHNYPGVNLPINYQITLTQSTTNPNVYAYTNDAFFPIDGQGFDNKVCVIILFFNIIIFLKFINLIIFYYYHFFFN